MAVAQRIGKRPQEGKVVEEEEMAGEGDVVDEGKSGRGRCIG